MREEMAGARRRDKAGASGVRTELDQKTAGSILASLKRSGLSQELACSKLRE